MITKTVIYYLFPKKVFSEIKLIFSIIALPVVIGIVLLELKIKDSGN